MGINKADRKRLIYVSLGFLAGYVFFLGVTKMSEGGSFKTATSRYIYNQTIPKTLFFPVGKNSGGGSSRIQEDKNREPKIKEAEHMEAKINLAKTRDQTTWPKIYSKDGAFYSEEVIAKDDDNWEEKHCPTTPLMNMQDFYSYIDTRVLHCEKPAMFGGYVHKIKPPTFDGEKWLCLSKKYNIRHGDCLIYSFGIDHDWTFDDDMDQKYECKVFAFDPTIGKDDHNRSKNIQFFNLGISDVTDRGTDIKKKVDRYVNIVKMLGHLETTIDYLKIDVEGAERQFFDDVLYKTPNLLKNVKMIAMEIHQKGRSLGEDQQRFWRYFQRLDCLGFKLFYSEINPFPPLHYTYRGQIRSCCYEMVWARDRQW